MKNKQISNLASNLTDSAPADKPANNLPNNLANNLRSNLGNSLADKPANNLANNPTNKPANNLESNLKDNLANNPIDKPANNPSNNPADNPSKKKSKLAHNLGSNQKNTQTSKLADAPESNPTNIIKGKAGDWEIVIGLEIHAQITAQAKLFSSSETKFGAEPNTQVSLVDAAMPGMLPVLNWFCVEQAVRTGLGLNAKINYVSVFERKNYFYADLPQGYQISQFKTPIIGEGAIEIPLKEGGTKSIGIERLHLEQDAGKSLHDQHPDLSYVDLNRAGIALMEIVSKPDMRSASEAQDYIRKLRSILRTLGTCDGNMEEGSLRADVNLSVRHIGAPLGTRCELKNINSIRFVGKAIDYEAQRQIEILEKGGEVAQETRLFDSQKNITRSMRSKEEAHDYRYFPDPDLPPIKLSKKWVEEIEKNLPELPDVKKARFIKGYKLTNDEADILVASPARADYFEAVVASGQDGKLAAKMVIGSVFAALNRTHKLIEDSPVSATQLGELLGLVAQNVISFHVAKEVFEMMFEAGKWQGKNASEIVKAKNLTQMSDVNALEKVIDKILSAHPEKLLQAKTKPKLKGWFVGQVMKETDGKANPQMVQQLIGKKIGEKS